MSPFNPYQRVSFPADDKGRKIYGYVSDVGPINYGLRLWFYLVDTDTHGVCEVDARELTAEPLRRCRARGLRP